MSIIAGLSDFVIVNDSSPATQVWDLQRGLFATNTGAGNYSTWLSSGLAAGDPFYAISIEIISAASSDAGTTTTFQVPTTTFGPNLQLTTGNTFNIQNTGLYDGNQQFTVVDPTHLKIAMPFAGNATGRIVGAQIVDTAATLYALIDAANQRIVPPPYLATSSNANYSLLNTPPSVFNFTPTAANLVVTLPQMNLFGSAAKGRQLLIHNAGVFSFQINRFGGFAQILSFPPQAFVLLSLIDNTTQAGSFDEVNLLANVHQAGGNASGAIVPQSVAINIIGTNANLTAPRTWTLPPANAQLPGTFVLVADEKGGVTAANTLSVARAGSDTINNGTASVVLNRAFDFVLLGTDGNTNWTVVGGKGALAPSDLSPNAVAAVKVKIFAANGTYTPSTGMLYCIIEMVGGGGGGGGAHCSSSTEVMAGGGGGAGGYSRLTATAATIGASQAVTIGAGGNGGASGSNNGAAGSDTSVGTLCIGKGGSGGLFGDNTQVGRGGAGGVAGTGDVAAAGAPGGTGEYIGGIPISIGSGFGGSSFFGGGAQPIGGGVAANGVNGGNYGGGGSGGLANGYAIGGAGSAAGGNGSAGVVIISEYCNQ